MKRKKILFIAILVLLFSGLAIYSYNRPVFVGDSTKTFDSYIAEFQKMNQGDSHVLELEKDDVLSVEYLIDKGRMDVTIGLEGEKPIYQGNDVVGGTFTVGVPASGEYKIAVKAKHASGNISIIKKKVE